MADGLAAKLFSWLATRTSPLSRPKAKGAAVAPAIEECTNACLMPKP